MGIIDQKGALYAAVGLDTSGFKKSAEEAMKIFEELGLSTVRSGKMSNEELKRLRTEYTENIGLQKKAVYGLKESLSQIESAFSKVNVGTHNPKILAERERLSKAFKETRHELQLEENTLARMQTAYDALSEKSVSLRTEMTNTQNAMVKLRLEGKSNTEEYRMLEGQLGVLAGAFKKVKTEQDATIKGGSNLAGVLSGLQGIAGVFSAGAGAIGLFNTKSKEFEAIQTKIQSLIAITVGLQQVSNTLNETSAFRVLAVSKAKELWAKSTKTLNTQLGISVGLSKALMVGGIGVLIGGVMALVAAYKKWNAEQSDLAQHKNEAVKSIQQEVSSVQNLENVLLNSNNSYKVRQKALEQLKEIMPEYNAKLSEEGNLIKDNTGALKTYVEQLKNAALAKSAMNRVVESENKMTDWIGSLGKTQISTLMLGDSGQEIKDPIHKKAYEYLRDEREKLEKEIEKNQSLLEGYTAKSILIGDGSAKKASGISGKSANTEADNAKAAAQITKDLERQNIRDTISIMDEGMEKKREQIKNDYNERIALIDEKERELRERQKDNLTEEQKIQLEESRKLADLIQKKDTAETDKKDSDESRAKYEKLEQDWNEYYKAYGDFYEKRLAIINEYELKIQNAENEAQKASYGKERDNVLKELDGSMVEQSDLWIKLFSDAEKLTSQSIKKIIDDTQNLLDYLQGVEGAEIPTGFKQEDLDSLMKDPEKVKQILNELIKKRDLLNKRNPFGNVIQGFTDLKNAGKDVDKQFAAITEITKGVDGISSAINQIGGSLSGMGSDADDTVNKITSLIGNTASLASTGMQVGGPIGAAIGAVIGLGTGLVDMFGGAKELSENTIKSYDVYISTLDELISKQKELIQSTTGANAVVEAEKAKTIIEASMKASRDLGKEYLNSGAGWNSRSHGYKMKEVLGGFRTELKGLGIDLDSLGGRAEGLFDLSAGKITNLKEQIPTLWAKLDDSTRKYLQAVIDGQSELDDLIKTAQEAISGLTFDEAKDSLKSLLLDADNTFENIAGKFDDYMKNSIMDIIMDGAMKQKLKAWYENYVKALSDGDLSQTDVDELRKEYGTVINDLIAERDKLLKAAGLDLGKSSSSGTTGELKAQMTEGTGSQLVGLWTMTAMDIRGIREFFEKNGIPNVEKGINDLLSELQAIKDNTRDTAANTSHIEEGFNSLKSELQEIKKNTKPNNSRI